VTVEYLAGPQPQPSGERDDETPFEPPLDAVGGQPPRYSELNAPQGVPWG